MQDILGLKIKVALLALRWASGLVKGFQLHGTYRMREGRDREVLHFGHRPRHHHMEVRALSSNWPRSLVTKCRHLGT